MTDPTAGQAPTADDPRRKLSGKAAAERAGVAVSTWYDYTSPRASRSGRLIGPPPDGREQLSGTPWWYEATIDAWKLNRIGQGRRRDLTVTPPSPPESP